MENHPLVPARVDDAQLLSKITGNVVLRGYGKEERPNMDVGEEVARTLGPLV